MVAPAAAAVSAARWSCKRCRRPLPYSVARPERPTSAVIIIAESTEMFPEQPARNRLNMITFPTHALFAANAEHYRQLRLGYDDNRFKCQINPHGLVVGMLKARVPQRPRKPGNIGQTSNTFAFRFNLYRGLEKQVLSRNETEFILSAADGEDAKYPSHGC